MKIRRLLFIVVALLSGLAEIWALHRARGGNARHTRGLEA
jgi:hypothetical protein